MIYVNSVSLMLFCNSKFKTQAGHSGTPLVPVTQEVEAGDCKFKFSLGYTVRDCLKKQNTFIIK
jgi:hypothetical protein